jgi:cytochrome c peroxidase
MNRAADGISPFTTWMSRFDRPMRRGVSTVEPSRRPLFLVARRPTSLDCPHPVRGLAKVCLLAPLVLSACGAVDDIFCSDARCEWTDTEWAWVQSLANPDIPAFDSSNQLCMSPAAATLGKAFYFDTNFSGVATQLDAIKRPSPPARAAQGDPIGVSCATCHDLGRAGVDTTSVPGNVSVGAGWTDVNALPTVNAAYRQVMFWNGRADSLWALNVVVSESPTTMNGNRLALAHRVFDLYNSDYQLAFGFFPIDPMTGAPANLNDPTRFPPAGKPNATDATAGAWESMAAADQEIVNRILVNWAKAIAAYEYQLISRDSPFDQFVRAGRDSDLISGSAKRGARLFVGKGSCVDCHSGPMLTDEQFHDIGVPQTGLAVPTTADCPAGAACDCSAPPPPPPVNCSTLPTCAPDGARVGLARLHCSAWLRSSRWSDDMTDPSRQDYLADRKLTDSLIGAWRTPSLRDVALTAPYMHDGALATLEDVVWHYNTGGAAESGERVGVPAAELEPLELTDDEVADLVAFLETLTGAPLDNSLITPPPPR